MKNISMRQIHLDFHTSEHIPGIGRNFDEDAFAETLKNAHVNSVTCFSRCHHGWLYYPSKKFPERIHPDLQEKDLLGRQISACHKRGIKVPVYLPIQWDHYTAEHHPEWLVLDPEGRQVGSKPFEAGFYRLICLNTPYIDFVIEQALEVLDMYDADGIFLDIVNVRECSCTNCRRDMLEKGMDPEKQEDRRTFTLQTIKKVTERISGALRSVRQDIPIFYNHSHVRVTHRDFLHGFTHFELESLPSGGWGYWDFPITIRYARTLGIPALGQTGKFHSAWGDFHSLKRKASLEYECFRSLAFGAGCSIGDQLNPDGKLSKASYDRISSVYASVEEKEPWCIETEALVEIGVITPDRFEGTERGGLSPDIKGCTRMLQELGYQFDIIDELADFSKYRLIVMPDHVEHSQKLAEGLQIFIREGGAVFSTYTAGLDLTTGRFLQFSGQISSQDECEYEPDFIDTSQSIGKDLPAQEYVMYRRGRKIEAEDEQLVLAYADRPYFNRTWRHFCSHMHAPSAGEKAYPAIVQEGKVIHAAHPIFTTYNELDPEWYSDLTKDCLNRLLPKKILEHTGPSSILATVNEQKGSQRYVVHLLHYIAERRGEAFDTVHDVIPIHDFTLSLRLPRGITGAKRVPEQEAVEYSMKRDADGNYEISFHIDVLNGHQMIALPY